MSGEQEGRRLLAECCGNGRDNVIALATVATQPDAAGRACPCVREVDAMYEDGTFYIITWAKSNKVQQIAQNPAVAVSVHMEGIYGAGTGENLGWVLAPQNAGVRAKLREAFADWYDLANNEQDEDCVILAVHLTRVTVFRDHGAVRYDLDLTESSAE